MASVALRQLSKVFDGGTQALHALDLDVRDGELLVLLGPSGSGKTTVLRCIAGLEEPTSGDVVIGERVVTHDSPGSRDLAMVFQTPALYPHLSVRENIAFPLEMRGVADAQVERRVADAAARLGIERVLDRMPDRLAEGERQRAALARAMVRGPQAFLFDEPLSRLDAKLQPHPDLATGWDASQDGRLITFTLRPDVSWHDGKPFSAEDAAYTLSALRELSETCGRPRRPLCRHAGNECLAGQRKRDRRRRQGDRSGKPRHPRRAEHL